MQHRVDGIVPTLLTPAEPRRGPLQIAAVQVLSHPHSCVGLGWAMMFLKWGGKRLQTLRIVPVEPQEDKERGVWSPRALYCPGTPYNKCLFSPVLTWKPATAPHCRSDSMFPGSRKAMLMRKPGPVNAQSFLKLKPYWGGKGVEESMKRDRREEREIGGHLSSTTLIHT